MNVVSHGAKTDAYDYEKVQSFKKLGYTVECMTAYEDVLLVAVKGDQLLKYEVQKVYDTNKNKLKIRLHGPSTHKVFGKPVSEMQAIPDSFKFLISVHDNMLNFYDLEYFHHKSTITGSKNFNHYAVSVQNENDSQGIYGPNLKICTSIGRKLMIYEWDGMNFVPIISDLSLSEPVCQILWCKSFLFVGLRNEYLLLNPMTGDVKDLCKYGHTLKEPLMLRIGENRVILEHDNTSLVVRSDGKTYDKEIITWTGVPSHIVFDSPYLVAILPRYLEVRSFKPSVSIQQIDVRHVINVCNGEGVVFVHCKDGLYMLKLRPLTSRIKYMIKSRNYAVAIQLQEKQLDLTMDERISNVNAIKAQQAVYLFTVMKFREAMDLFASLGTDPSHVIGMLPDLLPSKLSNSLEYPEKIPTLQGKDLTKALSELVEYLLKKKSEIMAKTDLIPFSPIMVTKRNNTLKSKDQAMSVIDTTLLKCYMQIDIARVRDLLLYPENCVHYTEAEKALKHAGCYPELILLYKQHRDFDTALMIMKEQAPKSKSSLCGLQPTIELLQELGTENLKLIFKYGQWVLEEDPNEGLKIFTAELPLVQELPRERVAKFIEQICPVVLTEYLEHLVYNWKDETKALHVMLADLLRDRVMEEFKTQSEVQNKDMSVKAGTEDGMLGFVRQKFIRFLKTTSVYDPSYVWSKLPLDKFYEERAIVLGLMGKHEQALGVYVYVLEDLQEVDEYCDMMYNKGTPDIYLSLLKVYLYPPKPLALGLNSYQRQPKTQALHAITLIESHASKIDLLKAIEILPDDIKMEKASAILELTLNASVTKCYLSNVVRNVQYQNYLQTSAQHQEECCKAMITMTECVKCLVCDKKITCKSAFVRNSNGGLVHYGCYGNPKKSSE